MSVRNYDLLYFLIDLKGIGGIINGVGMCIGLV